MTRMKRVMGQLRQRTLDETTEKVDLTKLVLRAVSHCSDREPTPRASVPDRSVHVLANHERLLMAMCHALRNSQDATDSNGEVTIELSSNEPQLCCFRFETPGKGMEADFARDRPLQALSIVPRERREWASGAFQIRETILAYGGTVEVDSVVGKGTTLKLRLPLAASNASE